MLCGYSARKIHFPILYSIFSHCHRECHVTLWMTLPYPHQGFLSNHRARSLLLWSQKYSCNNSMSWPKAVSNPALIKENGKRGVKRGKFISLGFAHTEVPSRLSSYCAPAILTTINKKCRCSLSNSVGHPLSKYSPSNTFDSHLFRGMLLPLDTVHFSVPLGRLTVSHYKDSWKLNKG